MKNTLSTLSAWFSHAFTVVPPSIDDTDRELIDRVAGFIVKRQMVVPAMVTLETVRPIGGIGGAAMTFLAPYLTFFLREEESRRVARLLETRIGIDCLLERIEILHQNSRRKAEGVAQRAEDGEQKASKEKSKDVR